MAKYIDADRLIETLNKEKVPFSEDVNYFILNAPAADVVEVVRCKDCAFWSDSFEINRHRRCLNTSICTGENFYCAWGSRKDE